MTQITLDQYHIPGTHNLDTHPCLSDPSTYPDFRAGYARFQEMLISAVSARSPLTIYKFGYGDGQFLKKRSEGSAAVGFRALSKPFEAIHHDLFTQGARACDLYACEIYPQHVSEFREVMDREADFPAEYIYAAVASRWIFRQFGSIGLIGASQKLAIIRELEKNEDYLRYLGRRGFNDFFDIPQRFACDDLEAIEETIAPQLAASDTQLFLLGIGHVKSGLLHRLPRYSTAVFLDVGQGIDALAGIIDTEKPYFGGWENFRIDQSGLYEDVDYLSYLPYHFLNGN